MTTLYDTSRGEKCNQCENKFLKVENLMMHNEAFWDNIWDDAIGKHTDAEPIHPVWSCISQDIQSEDACEPNLVRENLFDNPILLLEIGDFLFLAFVAIVVDIFVASLCSFIDIFYCYSYERWGDGCTAIPPPCIECNGVDDDIDQKDDDGRRWWE